MRVAQLRGSDHTRIGAVAGIAEGRAAVGISRGGAAKVYAHTEPNEDAALFAVGSGGTLLAVADGHDGAHGAEAAIGCLAEEVAAPWCTSTPLGGEWSVHAEAALRRANQAVADRAVALELPVAPTSLSLALARPAEGLLLTATVGDSHIFRIDEQGAVDLGWASLGRPRAHFLGVPEETWHRENTAIGSTALDGTRALVLATDGLSEDGIGVRDPGAAVRDAAEAARAIEPARRPQWLARTVLLRAIEAHRRQRSGDNIAVAVLWMD